MAVSAYSPRELARRASKLVFTAADPFLGDFPGPRILIYHQIGAGLGRQMEVTERAFVDQMDWLADRYQVVELEAALARRGDPGSSRLVVLTFDDGYEDFYRLGFPVLQRHGMPFTLYLTTHPVESREPLLAGGGADPVTWDQVEAMAESGLMTLGAHTHRHPDLRTIGTDQVEDDLGTSDDLVARRMGTAPAHFTYPFGWWSPQAHPVVARRYASATVGSGPPVTTATDLLRVNRIPVQLADGVLFFKRKLRKGLQMEDRVRRRIAGYDGP
ncbi:N/A [soil metagenome]